MLGFRKLKRSLSLKAGFGSTQPGEGGRVISKHLGRVKNKAKNAQDAA